jgi:hypothetical protein
MTTIEKKITEIVEHALHCEETTYAVEALTELITASYSDGYSFAKNEAGLIEEVSNALAAD